MFLRLKDTNRGKDILVGINTIAMVRTDQKGLVYLTLSSHTDIETDLTYEEFCERFDHKIMDLRQG